MKVVHLCSNDIGGAANAAIRLHLALIQSGIESTFLSKYDHHTNIPNHLSSISDKSLRHYLDFGLEHFILKNMFPPEKGYSEETVLFTSPHSRFHPELDQIIQNSDIIHLHWTSHFVDYGTFFDKVNKPIVWTMHDMNPFTGGCHYSGSCMQFMEECIQCPQVEHTNKPMIAQQYFNYKKRSIQDRSKLCLVAPSEWLLDLSLKSKLFKSKPHYHIRNGFDPAIFNLMDTQVCKSKWSIPENKVNLLFVAHSLKSRMKGFDLLLHAINMLPNEKIHLTVVGKEAEIADLPRTSHTMVGHIKNETDMAELYNAADLFITPSLRDNLPNTVAESLMCGTPVLGFKIGGIAEMIDHGINGLFASETNATGLAQAIQFFLTGKGKFNRNQIHQDAFALYNLESCARQYLDLYKEMLN